MATAEILRTYSGPELKRMIRATNITGYSKLKKEELITLMMRAEHKERFKTIQPKSKRKGKQEDSKELKKKQKLNRQFLKQVKDTKAIEIYEDKMKFKKEVKKEFGAKPPPKIQELLDEGGLDEDAVPIQFTQKELKAQQKLFNELMKIKEKSKEGGAKPSVAKSVPKGIKKEVPQGTKKEVPKGAEKKEVPKEKKKLSKVFNDLSASQKKKLEQFVDEDILSSNLKSQQRAFNNIKGINEDTKITSEEGEDNLKKLQAFSSLQEIADEQDDETKFYELIYGKIKKNEVKKGILETSKFLMDRYRDISASDLGGLRSFFKKYDDVLLTKLRKHNKDAYKVVGPKTQRAKSGE